mgnify:CR=1 FL=1
MISLSRQEKSVLLFLAAVVLIGMAIGYLGKILPGQENPVNISSQKISASKVNSSTALTTNASTSFDLVRLRSPQAAQDKSLRVNLNKASLDELVKLPGIGEALAGRILDYRDTAGGFKSIEDIRRVKGIGESKFAAIKDKLSVE